MGVTIYHNPKCSKSRQTLRLLKDRGIEPRVIEYLETPPSTAELDGFLGKLGMEPRELMRRKETPYKEKGHGNEECEGGSEKGSSDHRGSPVGPGGRDGDRVGVQSSHKGTIKRPAPVHPLQGLTPPG